MLLVRRLGLSAPPGVPVQKTDLGTGARLLNSRILDLRIRSVNAAGVREEECSAARAAVRSQLPPLEDEANVEFVIQKRMYGSM